jgi:hypothetical protein
MEANGSPSHISTKIQLFILDYLDRAHNSNPNLYYTVECKPNLTASNIFWDGSYRVLQDIKSSNTMITIPVGVFYQVVGSTNPMHTISLSPSNEIMAAGYYEATNLSAVATNLQSENIAVNVTIFGITGTLYSAAVPKTGQTTSYLMPDDGAYERGVANPNPRFTVQVDTNCVLDNLTGLIWARNANILLSTKSWTNAVLNCESLNYGGQTDWRLPNIRELLSVVDYGMTQPALPLNHPFKGVLNGAYWSSSTRIDGTLNAWNVNMYSGLTALAGKTTTASVWPVRGGK